MSENHPQPDDERPAQPDGSAPDPQPPERGSSDTPGDSMDSYTSTDRTRLSELVPLHIPAWVVVYLLAGVVGATGWITLPGTLGASVGKFVVGAVMLLLGGQLLVDGAISLARALGIPPLLIGMTIVAVGTSAPELAFNVIAAVDGQTELSLGNVVGSNIANIGLVLGMAALVSPLVVHSRVVVKELPILIGVTAALIVLAFVDDVDWQDGISRGYSFWEGLSMVLAFLALLGLWFRLGRSDAADPLSQEVAEAMEEPPMPVPLAVVYITVGLVGLMIGGQLAKLAAVDLASGLGMSQTMIGLTIVALATSLPEMVTCVIACRRGHTDLAVGNIVGSNLFNILLVLGVTCMIAPVPLASAENVWDLVVMGVITLILLPMAITNQRRITRWEGAFLLLCYLLYMAYTIFREQ